MKGNISNANHSRILVSFIIFFFTCFLYPGTMAADFVFKQKYRFGYERRHTDGKPVIYPGVVLREDNGLEDNSMKNIVVSLSVLQRNDNVIATLIFSNKSNKTYFLPTQYYPMRFQKSNGEMYDGLCGESFIITSNDVSLDYLSGSCPFDLDVDMSGWMRIMPGKKVSVSFTLNDMYAFLPGLRNYTLSSQWFKLVTPNWFALKSLNNVFYLTLNKEKKCDSYNIKYFLGEMPWDNTCQLHKNVFFPMWQLIETSDNYSIYVRANNIMVKINGDVVSSPY